MSNQKAETRDVLFGGCCGGLLWFVAMLIRGDHGPRDYGLVASFLILLPSSILLGMFVGFVAQATRSLPTIDSDETEDISQVELEFDGDERGDARL